MFAAQSAATQALPVAAADELPELELEEEPLDEETPWSEEETSFAEENPGHASEEETPCDWKDDQPEPDDGQVEEKPPELRVGSE